MTRIGVVSSKMDPSKKNPLTNPLASANLLSVLFFGWSIPMFKKSHGKQLNRSDVFDPLDGDRSNYLADRLER